ncbi:hypothetical protein RB195_004574 [Necator americanus]|uniref:Uncharacterized protein n=1 Tax=Necator americanus TaxID=51031 RepID=A0ABR1BIN2_NECAM
MSITQELSSSMNGVAALEQRQQPATSTADWTRTLLPSGLSLVRSLPKRRHRLRKKTPVGTHPLCRRLRHSRCCQRGSGDQRPQSCDETWVYPFNSRQSPSDPRRKKSAGLIDPSHFDDDHQLTRVSINLSFFARIERSFSKILLLEMRVGPSATLTRTVSCGFLEDKTRRRKPNRTVSVSYTLVRFRSSHRLFEKNGETSFGAPHPR